MGAISNLLLNRQKVTRHDGGSKSFDRFIFYLQIEMILCVLEYSLHNSCDDHDCGDLIECHLT